MRRDWSLYLSLLTSGFVVVGMIGVVAARQQANADATQAASAVAIDADDIGGVVTSANGPEAGVWVIAETSDLPTKFRKIVVTDDRGRFVVPDLPKANYRVWVRGYGLVDSQAVQSAPGNRLALTAVLAPNAKAAAQYYPANYWFALMQLPPKDAFPMLVHGGNAAPVQAGDANPGAGGGGRGGPPAPTTIESQEQWMGAVKGCIVCHQMGGKATREISPALGKFDSSADAWNRRLQSGQLGLGMLTSVSRLGSLERGLAFYADWTDRIAAGELPQTPPRPQGIERNIVISSWDVGKGQSFIHEIGSADRRDPGASANANGPVYGVDWHNNTLEVLNVKNSTTERYLFPTRDKIQPASSQIMTAPSPYWGEEIIIEDIATSDQSVIDREGRAWQSDRMRLPGNPAYCYDGSIPSSKHWPLKTNSRQMAMFDPKTKVFKAVDTCFGTHHGAFGYDKDDTLYWHGPQAPGSPAILGWFKTKVYLETGSEQAAQGWCPAFIDVNGDGKIDPKVDKPIVANLYAVTQSPSDPNVVWAAAPSVPGKIIRYSLGKNPPETCTAEVYEPPYNNPAMPGVRASLPRAVDVDTNGLAWVVLSASSQLASFDRSKCKVLTGPTATGQHCPEGWTIYPFPGPNFKGVAEQNTAEWAYYGFVDRYDALGLGANTPIVTGTNSDSLMAFNPTTKTWIMMRVPYPMGLYERGLDGRIDDANAGWKGRGIWTNNGSRALWHTEGAKTSLSQYTHFQIRPDPLAK